MVCKTCDSILIMNNHTFNYSSEQLLHKHIIAIYNIYYNIHIIYLNNYTETHKQAFILGNNMQY